MHQSRLCILCALCLAAFVTVASAQQRRVLLEIFSTENCIQCPQAHSNISRIFGDGGDSIVMVGHHAGFYTDQLTIPESVDYEWFYSPGRGLYAPAAMMNRYYDPADESDTFKDGVPVINGASASKLQSAYAAAMATPLSVKVELTTDYDTDSRKLDITVSSSLLRRLPNAGHLRMNVFLTEDSIFSRTQSGAYGSYYHRHAVRQCLTGTWGEAIDLNASVSCAYTTVIPEEWDATYMEVIAFVSSYDPADRCNCQVYNTAAVSVAERTPESITALAPDGATSAASYNLLGQPILAGTSMRGLHIERGRLILSH